MILRKEEAVCDCLKNISVVKCSNGGDYGVYLSKVINITTFLLLGFLLKKGTDAYLKTIFCKDQDFLFLF